ncbi:DNA repair protein RecN [Pontimicrobium aquaticum]|uniref:DNA repair protein RecN n=1 Tax=Pontimicrobium aquaticum TaxID=2565367 RepID=A0A4U0EWE0_9FLAO|nr:DNA repair protein RecN [Pontimicrobium aquaticum]TJY36078.1 DNA repair protein RecN [Pontimicrobium aquaticum]
MLTNLSIKNYALIEDLQISFNNGLSIITGETGAGKSILLGGLSLILGKRADLSSVKNTSKKCIVEATFDIVNYNLKSFFKNEDLDYEAETIIRREILPSGKSRAFINDSPVTLNTLTQLGNYLIDIHSQHQTLELTNDDFQFQIIDALAKNTKLLEAYNTTLVSYNQVEKTLELLKNQKAEAVKEYDYNLFLFNELEEAKLVSGELEELENEYESLNNVEEIKEELLLSNQLLNDEQIGILSNLTQLKNSLQKLSKLSKTYSELFNRVNSVLIELDDVVGDIEKAQDNLEANPNRLEEVNTKLQKIHNLLLKHSASNIVELIDIKTELSNKVLATQTIDDTIFEKENLKKDLEEQLNKLAKELHKNRSKVIPELTKQLETILAELGMPNAKFNISVFQQDTFYSNGNDKLNFLFTANKGGEFKPLKKAASGGELSRIMLAVKSILAKYVQLPSIMFDEIDTGVSGEISNKMAIIMQQMSKSMQVFTITHLPQIAAKGDTHFKVFKEDLNNKTITQMVKLNTEERIVEIAQMLGGKEMSTSAIAHAKQLLN